MHIKHIVHAEESIAVTYNVRTDENTFSFAVCSLIH